MHIVLSLASILVFGSAQARLGSDEPRASSLRLAPTRVRYAASCINPTVNPPPPGDQCGVFGSLRNEALYNRDTINARVHDHVNACATVCLESGQQCQSFSYDASYRLCTLYFRALSQQQLVPGNTSAVFYDRGCYTTACSTPRPAPSPTTYPASTCSSLNRQTPLRGSFCDSSTITLTQPDLIGHGPPNHCALACLNSAQCQSFSFNGHNNTCNLYGKTIKQQGPQKVSGQQYIYYYDKGCEYKSCLQCYPPKPTATFSPTSPGHACTPTITTQLVQNPSFEDNANGSPWVFGPGVSLVQNDPANAFSGQNYVKFVGNTSTPVPSCNQTLQNLTPGSDYRIRFALRRAQNDNPDYCTLAVYADGLTLETLYFQQAINTTTTYPAYYQQYANFIPTSSSSDLAFELSCYAYGGPVTLFLDNVDVVPAAPVCSFHLQTTSTDPHYNGLYLGSTRDYFIVGDRAITLVANSSKADVFGIDPFGFVADSSYPSLYFRQPYVEGVNLFSVTLGNYGLFGEVLCQVKADQTLSCVNKLSNSHVFRWCSVCLQDTIGNGLYFLDEGDPFYAVCSGVGLNAVFVTG